VWWIGLAAVVAALAVFGAQRLVAGSGAATPRPVLRAVTDDAGDARATTTYDGPMVRRRAAVAIRPTAGADRAAIRRQVRAAAAAEKIGPLTDATFAVFSPELLRYLVPEVVLVLPEGATEQDAEVVMRDHRYPTVAFHLVESVLVHDLSFAVVPEGVPTDTARGRVEREGVLSDSLGSYTLEAQAAGLVVRYFGALISDGQVLAVRAALARAAQVTPDRVFVEASTPGAGVDLSTDQGAPTEAVHQHR
jgi:hypothetical protein